MGVLVNAALGSGSPTAYTPDGTVSGRRHAPERQRTRVARSQGHGDVAGVHRLTRRYFGRYWIDVQQEAK
jgi:hypothetical protein